MKHLLVIILSICFVSGCRQPQRRVPVFSSKDISKVIGKMTDIMVHDVTNPPLAARFFSYACLAGYEVIAQNQPEYKSMYGLLNNYPLIQKPDSIKDYSIHLSSLLAMMETAKKMQPSGKLLEQYQQNFLDSCEKIGFSEDVIEASQRYALYISKHMLSYAKADNYNRISNYPRYTPVNTDGSWFPTPPAYLAPVEPFFNTVRPFTLDSCTQFKPEPPIPFSADKSRPFYKLMLLNYQHVLTDQQKEIAAFWDCNPFAMQDNGHLLVGIKKISPGAHWMGITGIACSTAGKNFSESLQIFTGVSIGLMDGFICCWDEKYRSNRIRPETAIRKYIDPAWKPFLQTPPFPEYLSGHSTISAVSATVLTHYFGKTFHYNDTVEQRFGLPARSFTSFQQAAEEAAISRFYGGIHFMDAIDNGMSQGREVGKWVLNTIGRSQIPIASNYK